ncbi:Arm DNA-binding domain-containing protein [Flagellimonas aurea]|nr:Arm DNA-binding domain-containing protein [Allomuricauda aurea]
METNTFSSIFYLRNSRLDKNGKAGVYFRITVNG